MSDSLSNLQRKIGSATELKSVVRTMKAMAAASITQYENAVHALDDYFQTVQSGLQICLRHTGSMPGLPDKRAGHRNCAVIFGSDQGLIGQFNEAILDFAIAELHKLPAGTDIWPVGERVQSGLEGRRQQTGRVFRLPASLKAVTGFVADLLAQIESGRESGEIGAVYLFFHHPDKSAGYQPVMQRLLPLDHDWRKDLLHRPWTSKRLPEVVDAPATVLRSLIAEYLFVSLFRACAESLASENASRLAAMQRAEKNIDDILDDLHQNFQHTRQEGIDEELFDLIAGFEALNAG